MLKDDFHHIIMNYQIMVEYDRSTCLLLFSVKEIAALQTGIINFSKIPQIDSLRQNKLQEIGQKRQHMNPDGQYVL